MKPLRQHSLCIYPTQNGYLLMQAPKEYFIGTEAIAYSAASDQQLITIVENWLEDRKKNG